MMYRNDYSRLDTELKSNAVIQMAAMAYLVVARGLKPIHAAGIVANADSESGGPFKWDPKVKGDGGKALGVFQWHSDRNKNLVPFAKARKANPWLRSTQIDFALHEMGLLKGADKTLPGHNQRSWARKHLINSTTAKEAGSKVSIYFEGPREVEKQAKLRGDKAQAFFEAWSKLPLLPANKVLTS